MTLSDQNGRILSSSSLGAGEEDGVDCVFHFTLSDVRTDEAHYSLEISHRGEVVNSRAEMVSNGWDLGITLGDD